MSINVKKYTKDQMAKMVEDAQAEVQELRRVNAALTEQIDQMNGEAINKANEIANLKATRMRCETSSLTPRRRLGERMMSALLSKRPLM